MKKIIKIDGRAVPFESNGAALLHYKKQFGSDLLPDLLKTVDTDSLKKVEAGTALCIEKLDAEIVSQICWTFARIADKETPPLWEWLESFQNFPLVDVFLEVIPMLTECVSCSAEIKNAVAAAGYRKIAGRSGRNKSFLWPRRRG